MFSSNKGTNMKKVQLLIALVCAFVSTIPLSAQVQTGFYVMNYDNSGVLSPIAFYVPEDYDATKSYPFIYAWHGGGMPAQDMVDLVYFAIANSKKAIVCAPDINDILSDNTRINALVSASLGYSFNNFNIDTNKTIITGFSMGGGMAFQIGLMVPEHIKGIITFSPAVSADYFNQTMWNNLSKSRIATILGDQDDNYSIVSGFMKDLQEQGANLLYLEKPGVEHADQTYYTSQEFANDYEKCYNYVLNIEQSEVINTKGRNIMLYPNPAMESTNLYIELSELSNLSLQMYNNLGELIETSNYSDLASGVNKIQIDTRKLNSGVYTLVLNYAGKKEITFLNVLK